MLDSTTKRTIGLGRQINGLYYLIPNQSPPLSNTIHLTTNLWHRRLGHPSTSPLQILSQTTPEISFDFNKFCDVCHLAKQSRLPFSSSGIFTRKPFDLIHCDIWGPHKIYSYSGARYFLTIVDDFSRYTWIHLMRHKSETQSLIKNFFAWVKTQHNCSIKNLRSDNGQEFLSLEPFFNDHGTNFHRSCVYTPQQNGVVERKHRHLLNVARALRFQANLPLKFWGEHVKTAFYIINRLPTPLLSNHTPYERLHKTIPSYSHLRVYGCLCFATNLQPTHKFDARSRRCVFLGYPSGQKGYLVYDLEDRKFLTSRDVVFHETIFPYSTIHNDEHDDTPTLPKPVNMDMDTTVTTPLTQTDHSSRDDPIILDHELPTQQVTATDTHGVTDNHPTPRQSTRTRRIPPHLHDYQINHALPAPASSLPVGSSTKHPISRYVSYSIFPLLTALLLIIFLA